MNRREFIRNAAALGLTAGGAAWRRALAAPVPASKIRGHVVAEGRPVAGVRVSDGFRVTVTDDSGEHPITV